MVSAQLFPLTKNDNKTSFDEWERRLKSTICVSSTRVWDALLYQRHGAIRSSVEQIADKVLELPERQRLANFGHQLSVRKKDNIRALSRKFRKTVMFVSVWWGSHDVTEVPELSKSKQHNIDVGWPYLSGRASVVVFLIPLRLPFVLRRLCHYRHYGRLWVAFLWALCLPGLWFTVPELEPRLFSFNAPLVLAVSVTVWASSWRWILIW